MSVTENNLGFLLADSTRLLRRAFQNQMQDSGLTLAQARALIYVSRNEGVRQVELAEMLEIQPITLARLLDQLTQQGLVERRADPSDRRAYLIYLTDAATPHLNSIKQVGSKIKQFALQGMNDEQALQFMQSLNTIRDQLYLLTEQKP
ncbi:MAG: DNA-binding MarR family transcriptional regulator [Paraglaciecola sp.]|jgi:DNA-binding MarR family transcriptional regulator